jgi:hypothetical protein
MEEDAMKYEEEILFTPLRNIENKIIHENFESVHEELKEN